jgi:hypothetical protein
MFLNSYLYGNWRRRLFVHYVFARPFSFVFPAVLNFSEITPEWKARFIVFSGKACKIKRMESFRVMLQNRTKFHSRFELKLDNLSIRTRLFCFLCAPIAFPFLFNPEGKGTSILNIFSTLKQTLGLSCHRRFNLTLNQC